MLYRDLIPSAGADATLLRTSPFPKEARCRLGPLPPHRFSGARRRRGWVRLVYEDQGEPFVLKAGDLVLQPPEIRHRVLESSTGLEVVEIASPAVHEPSRTMT